MLITSINRFLQKQKDILGKFHTVLFLPRNRVDFPGGFPGKFGHAFLPLPIKFRIETRPPFYSHSQVYTSSNTQMCENIFHLDDSMIDVFMQGKMLFEYYFNFEY